MDFAANAVTDQIAPAPPPAARSSPRDDADARFQDHLDAQSASDADHDESGPTRANAKATKPSKTQPTQPHDARTADDADAADAAADDAKPGDAETPAHALIVQVLPQDSAKDPKAPTPATPQQGAQPQPGATAPAPPANASLPTQAPGSHAHATQPGPSQPTQKPGKTDAKTSKTVEPAPQASEQASAQQADTKQAPVQTIAPPPAQAAPAIAPHAAPATTTPQTPAASKGDAAIGTVQANGKGATAPKAQAPAPAAPQTAAPNADAAKDDQPKANAAARAEKAASATTGAQTSAPNGPDFAALANAASANSENGAPLTASLTSSAVQAATPTDPSALDPTSARAAAAPVSAQVAREIVRRVNGDNTRFELRLDPPELGKIQVQLDVSRDHKVTAVVSADNPQALSDLSRGARDLQQALQSAGLDLADDGLSFNLSNPQNGFSQPDQSNNGNNGNTGNAPRNQGAENQSSADTSSARARPLSIESWRGARIDVMA